MKKQEKGEGIVGSVPRERERADWGNLNLKK